jgi:hypothetical protein
LDLKIVITERVKIGIFWAAIGPEAMKKCEEWKFDENDKATVIAKIDSKLEEERIPFIDGIDFQQCERNVEKYEPIKGGWMDGLLQLRREEE